MVTSICCSSLYTLRFTWTSDVGVVSKYLFNLPIFFSTYSRIESVTSIFSPRILYFIQVSSFFRYIFIILLFHLHSQQSYHFILFLLRCVNNHEIEMLLDRKSTRLNSI